MGCFVCRVACKPLLGGKRSATRALMPRKDAILTNRRELEDLDLDKIDRSGALVFQRKSLGDIDPFKVPGLKVP